MKSNEYRKNVMLTLSFKDAKAGIRTMVRKRVSLNLGHALIGLGSEIQEFTHELVPYLLGNQLSAEIKAKTRPEFGDVLYYLGVATKMQKIKLPSSTKKLKLHGQTTSEAVFELQNIGQGLVSQFKKVYYGLPLNDENINALLERLIPLMWQLSYTLYGEPPAALMVENIAKLKVKFGEGAFDVAAIHAKDAAEKAEKAAAKAALAAAPAAEATPA